MNTNRLSAKAKYELGYIIYSGLSDAMDHSRIDKEILKELLSWYESNVIMSYNHLKEQFEKVR